MVRGTRGRREEEGAGRARQPDGEMRKLEEGGVRRREKWTDGKKTGDERKTRCKIKRKWNGQKKKVAKGGDDIGKLDGGVEKLWGQVRKEQVHTQLVWAYEWGSYRSYHTVSMILAQATPGPKQPSWGITTRMDQLR